MPYRSRCQKWPLAALACVVGVAGPTDVASASPAAHTALICKRPAYPGLGYFTSLSVTGTNCATATKLIVAYYHCRTRSGLTGRCRGKVLGFSCHEGKRNSIATEFDARVRCRRQNAIVVHTYQQDI